MNAVAEMPAPLVFTDSAANKVKQLIDEEGNTELKLRVFVTGGGCSGFQHGDGEKRGDVAHRPDELPVSRRRRDRLHRRPRGCAVRDQKPQCDEHLRLRFFVLRISPLGS